MSPTGQTNFRDLTMYELDKRSIGMLPLTYCRRNNVVVLGKVDMRTDQVVHIGMLDPDNRALIDDIRNRLAKNIEAVRLNKYEISHALDHQLDQETNEGVVVRFSDEAPTESTPPALMVNHILQEAVRRKASDIHIESWFHDVDLRLRIDGILHQMFTHMNPNNVSEIISRLKIMADLDITERRKPQDGRIRVLFRGEDTRKVVDFRLSIVPSPAGEDAVIRVLDASQGLLPLEKLGMPAAMEKTFEQLLSNPEGMILVTGPTGCGKTTSLYASLVHIRTNARKIITAEDPIEYYIDKINQKEATPVMDLGDLMRSLMRQDPDVLLFGEIRDTPMGELALEASTTGHVVLSTLHTADAIGAVTRLRSLDLEDNDIAGALLGIVGQRLVRSICKQCKTPTMPNERQEALFGELLTEDMQYFEGSGCEVCHQTGYKGRLGVFELLVATEELQDMIAEGQRRSAIRKYLRAGGFRTMLDDGLLKVHEGATTLAELERVLPFRHIVDGRHEARRKGLKA